MSTSTVPPAPSCATTNLTGISPPESSTNKSLAGFASTAATRPSSTKDDASRTTAPTSSCTHNVPGSSNASADSSTPRSDSAASRDRHPAKDTMYRSLPAPPGAGLDATTSSGPDTDDNTVPGLKRDS